MSETDAPAAEAFHHPVGDRAYIAAGGKMTEGTPGGIDFGQGTDPNGNTYNRVADDPTSDGWYSAQDHGEYNAQVSADVESARYHVCEDWNRVSGPDQDVAISAAYAVANSVMVAIGLEKDADVVSFSNHLIAEHTLADGGQLYSFYAYSDTVCSALSVGVPKAMHASVKVIAAPDSKTSAHLHSETYTADTSEQILQLRLKMEAEM